MATPKTVAFHTLGCKLNFSETSTLAQQFRRRGYGVVELDEGADIFVLNTCSVTDFADRKCRKVIRQVHRTNPETRVVVTGCYAQLKPQEIAAIPGVDLVLGAGDKFRIVDFVERLSSSPDSTWVRTSEIAEVNAFTPGYSIGDRTRTFLKIQDGCNYKCSFCTIPQARGKSRNGSVQDVISMAGQIAQEDIKEVVLTGVNIGDFRSVREDGSVETFYDVIRALDRVEGIDRFRISSIEPNLCSDEIIEFVAGSKKFTPHFHMPLQSGNNKQLAQMRRRYRRELYAQRVERIKTLMPHASIGVDVIVGFPGETDDDFRETVDFILDLDVSYLHVFTYSERNNTPAAEREDQVPMELRRERSATLRQVSAKKRRAFYRQFIGQTRKALIEHNREGDHYTGYTDNYIKVLAPADRVAPNTLVDFTIGEFNNKAVAMNPAKPASLSASLL